MLADDEQRPDDDFIMHSHSLGFMKWKRVRPVRLESSFIGTKAANPGLILSVDLAAETELVRVRGDGRRLVVLLRLLGDADSRRLPRLVLPREPHLRHGDRHFGLPEHVGAGRDVDGQRHSAVHHPGAAGAG